MLVISWTRTQEGIFVAVRTLRELGYTTVRILDNGSEYKQGRSMLRRMKTAVAKSGWLNHFNYKKSISARGRQFQVPVTGLSRVQITESWMMDLLPQLLSERSGTFIDVGVNLGQTLLKLRAVDQSRKYVGFEPNPHCVNYVHKLLKLNDLGDVSLFPVGISEKTEQVELMHFSESELDSAASIVKDFRPGEKIHFRQYISVVGPEQLESILGTERVGLLKVDVEGAELEVFKGFYDTLMRDKPTLLFEILPSYSLENTSRVERQRELVELLHSVGYQVRRLNIDADGSFQGMIPVDDFGIHGDLSQCEYVATVE